MSCCRSDRHVQCGRRYSVEPLNPQSHMRGFDLVVSANEGVRCWVEAEQEAATPEERAWMRGAPPLQHLAAVVGKLTEAARHIGDKVRIKE